MDMVASLQAYAACVDEFESALGGLSESDLSLGPTDGWNIRQIVHHLADGDELWKACILLALGNPEAEFHLSWYWDVSQDDWAEQWSYDRRDIATSLSRLRANRLHVVDLLKQKPEAWNYAARIHWPSQPDESRISIAEVVKMQTDHAHHHLGDVLAIREAHHERGPA